MLEAMLGRIQGPCLTAGLPLLVIMLTLAACGETLVPTGDSSATPTPSHALGDPPARSAADADSSVTWVPKPPGWEEVIRDLAFGECAVYWRRAAGVYTVEMVEIDYSEEALSGPHGAAVQVKKMVRPVPGTDLYELRLDATCLLPNTEAGREELLAALEVIFPDESDPNGAGASASAAPLDGARDLARGAPASVIPVAVAGVALARRPGGPECDDSDGDGYGDCDEIIAIIEATTICPAGFDWDELAGECSQNYVGAGFYGPLTGGTPVYWTPPGGSGGGSTSPTSQPPPPPPSGKPLELQCGSGPRGSEVQCVLSKAEGVEIKSAAWSFTPDGSGGRKTTLPGSSESWGGVAVESGSMEVDVTYTEGGGDEEHEETVDDDVAVSARSWTWPAGQNLGNLGAGLDSCAGWGGAMGITVGRLYGATCATTYFDRQGYDISTGSGPWSTGYYVSSTTDDSKPGAYWAYNPVLRQDGPNEHPVRGSDLADKCSRSVNVYVANVRCAASTAPQRAFERLRSEVESHEGQHIAAMVAESGNHDVWGEWEDAIGSSSDEVRNSVINIGGTNPAVAAQTAMHRAVAAVDGTYTPKVFQIWWWTGTEWRIRRINSKLGA